MSEFVSLPDFLRAATATVPVAEPVECDESGDGDTPCAELEDALAQARRFSAALAEALDAALETLLTDVAASVLARELQIAPADVATIVAHALERFAEERPVRVRVNPVETASIAAGIPVVADPRLRRGDVEIDVRYGTIDATLGARLQQVLRR